MLEEIWSKKQQDRSSCWLPLSTSNIIYSYSNPAEHYQVLFTLNIIIRAKRVSNWYTPQKKSARLPACTCQIILVLVFTYVSTTYVRTSARYQPATKIRICIYVSTEKHRSAIIVHKPNRTATSTTVHRRQNKPYWRQKQQQRTTMRVIRLFVYFTARAPSRTKTGPVAPERTVK